MQKMFEFIEMPQRTNSTYRSSSGLGRENEVDEIRAAMLSNRDIMAVLLVHIYITRGKRYLMLFGAI
jgi:hypothetical protein